jgi:hypothetical protein
MLATSIASMLVLVIFVGVALLVAVRYQTERPLSDLRRWFGAHRSHSKHERH